MQESIWTSREFPFLKWGFIAPGSAVAGQIDKAPFANVHFSYFDLGRYKNFIWSLLQGVAPPTDLFFYYLKKKEGERTQRYKEHLSSLKTQSNSSGARSFQSPASGKHSGQTSQHYVLLHAICQTTGICLQLIRIGSLRMMHV